MNRLLLVVFLLLIIPNMLESFADKQVEIKIDQPIHVDNIELNFHDVEDSRCPSDVTCVWEGQVTAMIRIQNQSHIITGSFTPGHSLTSIAPYKITLVDVHPHPISTEVSNYTATLILSDLPDEPACEENMIFVEGFCVVTDPTSNDSRETSPNIRIDDSTFNRQSLQTGETITELGSLTSLIIGDLGAILIVFFIIIYAIKKRVTRKDTKKNKK